jgi:hypothetical protein
MNERIKLVRGDTYPQLRLTLTDESTGAPINLTDATVTLHFRAAGASKALFSRQGFVSQSDALEGKVVFVWQQGDLNLKGGNYEGEVEVFWANTGARQTVFEFLKFRLREEFN